MNQCRGGYHPPDNDIGDKMKKYTYVDMQWKTLVMDYVTSKETGKCNFEQVIDSMAAKGWKYVDHIMTHPNNYSYTLVFEKDVEE